MQKLKIIAFLLALSLLAGCGSAATAEGSITAQTVLSASPAGVYAAEDSDAAWSEAEAVPLTDGTEITAAGTDVVSGSYGQIVVNAGKNDLVRIVLNGADISCTNSAPIYVQQAQKVVLILADGTKNTVTDTENYASTGGEDDPTAAIYSMSDLSITGAGELTVQANYKQGIVTKDDLVVTDGIITVNAVTDGLRGRDSISINGGTFTITAGSDGLQANNDEDTKKGWVALDGGAFTITAGNDGVQSETALTVTGGTYQITTGGGAENGPAHQESMGMHAGASAQAVSTQEDTESAKGCKAGTDLTVEGGALSLDTADDALHGTNVTVNGGNLSIMTGDDGLHADDTLLIAEGTIDIVESYEGLEGLSIDVNGGDISLVASDDGFNAAGGTDSSGTIGGRDSFNAVTEGAYIRFTGGNIEVNASGDGIDSNGDLYFEGGTIQVDGPVNNGNGALDYNGTCTVTGGSLIAAGSTGMAQTPGGESAQPILSVTWAQSQQAGATVTVQDAKGNTVLSVTPQKQYQNILFTTGDLKQGEMYQLYSDTTKLCDVTLTDMVTSISSDGSAVSGGMGQSGRGQKGQNSTQNGAPESGGSIVPGTAGEQEAMPEPPAGENGDKQAPPAGGAPGQRPDGTAPDGTSGAAENQ